MRGYLVIGVVLLNALVGLFADEADERYQHELAEITADYVAVNEAATTTYAEALHEANQDTMASLVRLAGRSTRSGDHGLARTCWIEVLRLDRQHEEARAFVTAIGQLDETLAALDAPADDFLEDRTDSLPAQVRALVRQRDAEQAELLADWYATMERARATFVKAEARERERLVRTLERDASRSERRGELVAVTTQYRALLRVDREHERAIAFFSGIGTLDAVLAELGEPVTVDSLIGPIGQPGQAAMIAVGGAINGEGAMVVVLSGRDDLEHKNLLAYQPVFERLESRGFSVVAVRIGSAESTSARLAELEAPPALIIMLDANDSHLMVSGWLLEYLDTPIITMHPKVWAASRLAEGRNQGQSRVYGDELTIATDHPIAGSLSGQFRAHTFDDDKAKVYSLVPHANVNFGAGVVVATAGEHASVVAIEADTDFAELEAHPHRPPVANAAELQVPARRVGFFVGTAHDQWSTETGALFDQAVGWALASP